WLQVTLVCLFTSSLNPLYRRTMARGGSLRDLVYVQLIVDTIAIATGLALLGPAGLLFGYFFLMTIVPATMVSAWCSLTVTLVAAAAYGALVAFVPGSAFREATPATLFVVPIYIFAVVASQCDFYKRHMRDKNRRLAETG